MSRKLPKYFTEADSDFPCKSCGKIISRDDGNYFPEKYEVFCTNCYKRLENEKTN